MTKAFYNEIDPYAAQWLRNLIEAGHIAPGVVDERSIEDIAPDELRDFTQCHFFAGVGVWSLALRRAGWPDDRPVWTGSCPCQPFSAAGKGNAFADERHLWPAFQHLIKECRPAVVFGEQVASKVIDAWIDLVQADMEALDYAFGAVPFPSASVGAPHIRDRLYWVADADGSAGREGRAHVRRGPDRSDAQSWTGPSCGGVLDGVADAGCAGLEVGICNAGIQCGTGCTQSRQTAFLRGNDSGLADAKQHGNRCKAATADNVRQEADGPADQCCGHRGASMHAGPTNGFWRAADWLGCRDGKWRPVEPSTFPLAHGAPARVGRLRAYGNAINAEAARIFIEASM